MARRGKSGNTPAARGVIDRPGALRHIEALLDAGGQIMLGTVQPIVGAAVAHDGKRTVAMLKRQPGETVEQLLHRLDRAVHTTLDTGMRIDEINQPKSDVRYEIK